MKAKTIRNQVIWMIAASMFVVALLSTDARAQSQWGSNGTNIYYNAGNVGIGATNPAANLQVESSSSTTFRIVSTGDNVAYQRIKGSTGDWYAGLFGSADYSIGDITNSNATYLTVKRTSGNIGIGTPTPSFKLSVQQDSTTAQQLALQNDTLTAGRYSEILFRHSNGAGPAGIRGYAVNLNSNNESQLRFFTSPSSNSPTERMIIDQAGRVGIGTTTPAVTLDVNGEITLPSGYSLTWGGAYGANIPTIASVSGTGAYTAFYPAGNTSGERIRFTSSGDVGIGTTSPAAKLDVNGSVYTAGQIRANALSLLMWGADASGTNRVLSGAPNIESQDAQGLELGTSGSAPIVLYTGASERLRIDATGNTNVTGNINLTGTINAKYQDVAEWVPSSEQLSAGTVVVLDSTKSNQVISSSESYDTRVAGVISEQPGLALGEKSEDKVLVATTGRVKVKVDASKSPIRIGDLLVTSEVPGKAMKSEPIVIGGRKMHAPGTLIGKALEPLERGTGTILVLLSLQ